MEDVKWLLKKCGFLIVLMAIIIITGSIVLGKRGPEKSAEGMWEPPVIIESTEPVKDIPVNARQREEAEEDCKEMMGLISELYKNADKGCASNVVIADVFCVKHIGN